MWTFLSLCTFLSFISPSVGRPFSLPRWSGLTNSTDPASSSFRVHRFSLTSAVFFLAVALPSFCAIKFLQWNSPWWTRWVLLIVFFMTCNTLSTSTQTYSCITTFLLINRLRRFMPLTISGVSTLFRGPIWYYHIHYRIWNTAKPDLVLDVFCYLFGLASLSTCRLYLSQGNEL